MQSYANNSTRVSGFLILVSLNEVMTEFVSEDFHFLRGKIKILTYEFNHNDLKKMNNTVISKLISKN